MASYLTVGEVAALINVAILISNDTKSIEHVAVS